MKILFLFILPLACHSLPSFTVDVSVENTDHRQDTEATRRSGGSFDVVRQIKTGLISSAGRASAAVISGSAGTSSGGSGGGKGSESSHGNSIEFDPWSLKKSVLYTLFQAVKAITGGVTAIKGQLIKGSGYALSAGGQLIAASGDRITDVGKTIASSAQLSPNSHSQGHSSSSSSSSHPLLGKLSGLSSLSGGSSGGAKSVTAQQPEPETHGPTGHSESITTYDIPTSIHTSYGPPSKSPTYSSSAPQFIPTGGGSYTGSGGGQYESSAYEGPPTGGSYLPSKYGLPFDDHELLYQQYDYHPHQQHHHHHHHDHSHHFHEESPPLYEENNTTYTNTHDTHNYSTPITGPTEFTGPLPPPLKPNEVRSAAEALKEIIHLLPKTESKLSLQPGHKNKFLEQYAIPAYPVEKFKEFSIGPIESVSHTQPLQTDYGTPNIGATKPIIDFTNTISIPGNHESHDSYSHDPHPYDVYHSMTLKYKGNHNHHQQQQQPQQQQQQQPANNGKPSYIGSIVAALAATDSKNKWSNFKNNVQKPYGNYGQQGAQYFSNQNSQNYINPIALAALEARAGKLALYKKENLYQQRPSYEIQNSIGFQIRDPGQFNRNLLH